MTEKLRKSVLSAKFWLILSAFLALSFTSSGISMIAGYAWGLIFVGVFFFVFMGFLLKGMTSE